MAQYQTTYATSYAVGYPGMVANGETSDRISRTVEDVAGIAFGLAVFRGTGDHGCTATPTAGALLGITILTESPDPVGTTGVEADIYPQYATAGIMPKGVIWVTAGATVVQGAQVYVTSGGVFTSTSTSNTILPGWFFDQSVSSGALVRIANRG